MQTKCIPHLFHISNPHFPLIFLFNNRFVILPVVHVFVFSLILLSPHVNLGFTATTPHGGPIPFLVKQELLSVGF
jgi:hypothetical protein